MFGSKKKPSSGGTATPSGFENYMPAVISSLSAFFFNEESTTPDDLLKLAKKDKSPLYITLNDIIDSIPTIKQFEKSKIFTDIQKSVEKISLSVNTGILSSKLEDSIFLLDIIGKEHILTNTLLKEFPNKLNENKKLLSNITSENNAANEIIFSFSNAKDMEDLLIVLNDLNDPEKKIEVLKNFFKIFKDIENINKLDNVLTYVLDIKEIINQIVNTTLNENVIEELEYSINYLTDLLNDDYIEFIDAIINLYKNSIQISKIDISFKYLNNAINKIKETIDILPTGNSLIMAMLKIPMLINVLTHLIKSIDKLIIINKGINKAFNALEIGVDKINVIIDKLNANDPKDIDRAIQTAKQFRNLVIFSALTLVMAGILMAFVNIDGLFTFTGALLIFIGGMLFISNILLKQQGLIKGSLIAIKELSILVITSGLMLIFGGIMMNAIDVNSLLGFSMLLLGFITIIVGTLIGVLLVTNKYMNDANNALLSITKLIITSGLLLLFAGVLGNNLDFTSILYFAEILTLFITVVVGIYILTSKFIDKALNVSKNFGELIFISGMTLIFGSILMNFVNIENVINFVVSYAIFMGIIVGAYIAMNKFISKSINISKNFILLISISGMTLALGSLITKIIKFNDILLFTLMLSLFVGGIVTLFGLFGKKINSTIKISKEFGYLVAITGLTLIFGGLITQWINTKSLILFTGLLFVMVAGIVTIFGLFGKKLQKSIKYAKQLGLLVIILGAVLLIGGLLFMKFPDLSKSTTQFTTLMLVLLGGVGLVVYLLGKLGNKLKKGLFAASLITILCGMMAGTVAILSSAVAGVDMLKLWNGVGIMITMILGIAGLSLGLGFILTNPVALIAMSLGTTFMAAMAGILMMVGMAVKDIAESLEICSKIGKKVDFSSIINMITSSVQLAEALSKFLPYADTMGVVSDAAIAMSRALSKIAESVEDYASLKVPIYEGIKKVGYRSLNENDFKSAAKNVSKIITVLGGAIISTYEKNPDMFKTEGAFAELGLGSSKFDKVAKSLKKLGPLISNIAKGVKDYAELKIPIYEGNKTVGYKNLDENDFNNASKNVSLVITTLAGSVISTYDMNPEMFSIEGTFANLGFGSSKFDKVAKSLKVLGPLISSISEGIKDYAELKMPVEYNADGTVKKYRSLTSKDFFQASNNIGLVITTIANALIQTYENHSDMFKEPSGWFADSPFKIITESALDMGNLISNISEGIKDYVDLKIPTKYVDGKAVEWRQLESSDFKKASKNIGTVIGTIATALNNFYNNNTELFDDDEDSAIFTVLDAATKMGNMIGSIAEGIAGYVEMLIPTKWDKEGKPIEFKQLERSDLTKASDNIGSVIGTVGSALIDFYNKNTELFDDDEDSIMLIVLDAAVKMGDMISKISKGILSYATSQVPIEWDDKGNPINFAPLDENTIITASDKIGTVIGTIGSALKTFYDKHEDLFDDDEDSIMFLVLDAATKMGDMLGTIANTIVSYASSQVPIAWDKDGNPVKFELIDSGRLENAGTTIGNVIGAIGSTLITFYDTHKNDIFKDGEDSVFFKVLEASTNLGSMIKSIADGIVAYAGAQIPIKWNENGDPIDFVGVNKTITDSAAENIKNVITTVGGAIVDLYKLKPDMFDDPMFGDNAFTRTLNACMQMSDMITKIMEAVVAYSIFRIPKTYDKNGNIIEYFDGLEKDTVISSAGSTISTVLTSLGSAIIAVYDLRPEMFETNILKREPKFNAVIKSCTMMGEMLASIASALSMYASGIIPTLFDENGNPKETGSITLTGLVESAKKTITKVMVTLGDALIKLHDDKPEYFGKKWWTAGDSKLGTVMTSATKMGNMIASIGSGLKSFASLKLPIYDENGKITGYEEISETLLQTVPGIVTSIISNVGQALLDLAENDLFKENGNIISEMTSSCGNMGNFVAKIGKQVASIAKLEIPEYDENGKLIKTHKIKIEELSTAGTNINAVLTAMLNGFNFTADEVKNIENVNKYANDASTAFTSCLNIITIISEAYKASGSQISVFNRLFNKDNTLKRSKNIFPKISNFMGSIINAFYPDIDKVKGKNTEETGILKVVQDTLSNDPKMLYVIKAINNSYEIISAFNEFWKEFNNTITTSIIPSVNNDSLWKSLENFNNNKEKINSFFESINNISLKISSEININTFITLSKICEYLPNIFNTINDLAKNIESISIIKFETEEQKEAFGLTSHKIIKNVVLLTNTISYILDEFIPKLTDHKDNIQDAKTCISILSLTLTGISKMFNEVFESINFSAFEGTDTNVFDTLMKHVKHMFEEFTNLAKSNSSVKYNFLLSQVKDLHSISKNIHAISVLYSLTEPNNIIGFISLVTKINDTIKPTLFPYWGITKNAEYLSEYASHIYDISNLYGAISEKYIERFLKDVTDINLLIDTFNTDSIENLDNEAKSLGKYVKGVNELQLNKADKLIKMVETMNKLASNIGNLDKFSQHLVNDFGEVIERLTQQIDEAKKTMLTLDIREEERRKKLQEYIEHINEIMSNKLTVEITQATEETIATPGGGEVESLSDEKTTEISGGIGGSSTSTTDENEVEKNNSEQTSVKNAEEIKEEKISRRSSHDNNIAESIAEAMKGLRLKPYNGGYKFE